MSFIRQKSWKEPKLRHFALALVLSLLIHSVIGGGIWFRALPAKPPKAIPGIQFVEIENLPVLHPKKMTLAEQKRERQIVSQDEKPVNDEIDEKAQFMSAHNQRVVEQTRAQNTDRFKNSTAEPRQAKPVSKAQTEVQNQTQPKSNEDNFEFGDIPASQTQQTLSPSFRKLPDFSELAKGSEGAEASATDDHLPDIKTGMETMLSTREFVYYSYYNRIKERLRQYWEPKIKEKFEKAIHTGRSIASVNGDKITKLIIVLNPTGTLIGVKVVSASGIRDLDDAAVEAFRAAAPFPNPPKGIVEDDGTIKIRWDFVVEA